MKKITLILFFLILLFFPPSVNGQMDSLRFKLLAEKEYPVTFSAFSGTFHPDHTDVFYTANRSLGLITFQQQNDGSLQAIDTILPASFDNLTVSNTLISEGSLYVTLGNFQNQNASPGVAKVRIDDPFEPEVRTLWYSSGFSNGAAITLKKDSFLYVGAMDEGLLVLKEMANGSITFLNRLVPDMNFPSAPGLFTIPHARGMDIQGNYLFLCYDAGGLRVIDISDPENPEEVVKYINSYINDNAGRAYNNILIQDDIAYIAVDYCGVEILDVSNPLQPIFLAHFNPWDCSPTNWEEGDGHANELAFIADSEILLVSAGDSELIALDVSDPENPKPAGQYGMLKDSAAVWGLALSANQQIALFYLDNSTVPAWLPQPFRSDYGGVRLLGWDVVTSLPQVNKEQPPQARVYPNPHHGTAIAELTGFALKSLAVTCHDLLGKNIPVQFHAWPEGTERVILELVFPEGVNHTCLCRFFDGEKQVTKKLLQAP